MIEVLIGGSWRKHRQMFLQPSHRNIGRWRTQLQSTLDQFKNCHI